MRVEVERTEISAGKVFSRNAVVTRTVWELVEAVRGNTEPADVPADAAEAHLGRLGIRVKEGRLLIANTALGLQRLLANTAWSHSWPTMLSRIPGAEKAGKVRFKGMADSSRAVSLPLERP
jgi:hypothetical protein